MIIGRSKSPMKRLTTPFTPALGGKAVLERGSERHMQTFRLPEQVYFGMTGLAVVPVYILAGSFITMFLP